jgi:hypothetical protein
MKAKLADIISDPIIYLENLFLKISAMNINVESFEIDHICYRVSSNTEYEIKKLELLQFGELLIESMVNGRMISTFKLFNPIHFKDIKIPLIELPAPKTGASIASGLEHIEFVVPFDLKNLLVLYPHVPFDLKGIDKKINADITLKFSGECIRFHNQSLEEIIELEKKL